MSTSFNYVITNLFMIMFFILGVLLIISIYRFISEIRRIRKSRIRGATLAIVLAVLTAIMLSVEIFYLIASAFSRVNIVF